MCVSLSPSRHAAAITGVTLASHPLRTSRMPTLWYADEIFLRAATAIESMNVTLQQSRMMTRTRFPWPCAARFCAVLSAPGRTLSFTCVTGTSPQAVHTHLSFDELSLLISTLLALVRLCESSSNSWRSSETMMQTSSCCFMSLGRTTSRYN